MSLSGENPTFEAIEYIENLESMIAQFVPLESLQEHLANFLEDEMPGLSPHIQNAFSPEEAGVNARIFDY
jgi:hypothetical protein